MFNFAQNFFLKFLICFGIFNFYFEFSILLREIFAKVGLLPFSSVKT